MKIYNLYLLKNIFKYFLIIFFSLTSIIWVSRIIKYLYFVTEYGVDIGGFIKILILLLPDLFILTIPISSFLSITFLYNRLIKNNELIIFQNSGVSKFGFLIPILYFSIFIIAFVYSITLYFSPKSNILFDKQKNFIRNNIVNLLLNNINFNNFKDITFYAKNKKDNEIFNIIFYNSKDKSRFIYAETGKIVNDTYIILKNGNIQEFYNDELKTLYFDEYSLNIFDFYNIDIQNSKSDLSSLFLNELIKIEKKDNKIYMEIFNKIFTPFLSLTLSIISCFMILNTSFSRFDINRHILKIYIINIIIFVSYFYLVKLGENNLFYLAISFIILFLPIFYLFFNFLKIVLCLRSFCQKK